MAKESKTEKIKKSEAVVDGSGNLILGEEESKDYYHPDEKISSPINLDGEVVSEEKAMEWMDSLIHNKRIEDDRVINKKLTVTMVTIPAEETINIREFIAKKAREEDLSVIGAKALTAICNLAYSVIRLNGKSLGNDFESRYDTLKGYPDVFIDALSSEFGKFTAEILDALNGDVLKN
jgi:hypothetical protein